MIGPRSKVARRARALCVELVRVTGGRPMQWHMVAPIVIAAALDDADAAIAYAIGQGWLIGEGNPPHSVCLTDDGRALVDRG
jgi:hypothetical protein